MSADKPVWYAYESDRPDHLAGYLWQPVLAELAKHKGPKRIFDLGCGNGVFAAELARQGYEVTGVDPSESGIAVARNANPNLNLHVGNAYDDLAARFGTFPYVVSLEVIEHVFYPRKFAKCVFDLLEPGGVALISTPYHGYLKNIAIAVTNKFDHHMSPLWDYGHIKFWSIKTLTELLKEIGFEVSHFLRVGRVPFLAKSMVAVVRKPK